MFGQEESKHSLPRTRSTKIKPSSAVSIIPGLELIPGLEFIKCEPVRKKTNNLGSDQVRHKLACTVTDES